MSKGKFGLTMLEYSKYILSKMSFSKNIFRKEYRKAFRRLDTAEREALRAWVRSQGKVQLQTKTIQP